MYKICYLLIFLAGLSTAFGICAAAEEGETSFQQLMQFETPAQVSVLPTPLPLVTEEESGSGIRYEADGSVVVTITAVGDVTIGRNVQSSSTIFQKELDRQEGDIGFIFRNVRDIFESDDLTIVNFEGVLADQYTIPSRKKEKSFLGNSRKNKEANRQGYFGISVHFPQNHPHSLLPKLT